MKYPNLRYGNPLELQHYAQGMTTKELAKRLRRSERSVKDWLEGKKKIPFWVPELLRLQQFEHQQRMYQMNMKPVMKRLGVIQADAVIYQLRPRRSKPMKFPELVSVLSDIGKAA
jgi:hypothetical protein